MLNSIFSDINAHLSTLGVFYLSKKSFFGSDYCSLELFLIFLVHILYKTPVLQQLN